MSASAARSGAASNPAAKRAKRAIDNFQPSGEISSLRHFALKVCQAVEMRVATTYNEVADDLVYDVLGIRPDANRVSNKDELQEERNVRRRVYDALNVLEAMNIICKTRKTVRWIGFPESATAHVDRHVLLNQQMEQKRRIEQKEKELHELVSRHVAYTQLVTRNKRRCEASEQGGAAGAAEGRAEGEGARSPDNRQIHVPFVLAATRTPTLVDCVKSDDGKASVITFKDNFTIHDDCDMMRCMGLERSPPSKQLQEMLPKIVYEYIVHGKRPAGGDAGDASSGGEAGSASGDGGGDADTPPTFSADGAEADAVSKGKRARARPAVEAADAASDEGDD